MRKGKLKKVVAFLLSLTMVLSLSLVSVPGDVKAAGKPTFTLSADKQELKRGDEVTVTLRLSENTDAWAIGYKMFYDTERLELIGAPVKGEVIQNAEIGTTHTPEGKVNCAAADTTKPMLNGVVMQMKFKVRETAPAGQIVFRPEWEAVAEYADPLEALNVDNTNLSVVVPATGISIDKTEITLGKGTTDKLTAALIPEGSNSTITWSSSNESIVSVTEDGLVTANAVGRAKITATANGHSAECTVTVINPLESISIEGIVSTIKKGTTTQLKVVYSPEDATEKPTATWNSSNPEVATVDANGLVTAIADGKTVITATAGGKTATYEITVREVKLDSISIKDATTIHRGEEENLTVTYNPEDTTDSRDVTWTSSDESIVKVDGNGKVTALGIGEADVTAQVGNHKAVCKVTVDSPLKAIIPEKSDIDMVKNQTAEIKYTLNPEDTTDSKVITFVSDDLTVASVDETGVVTANKAGETTITLTGTNGITATVHVTVTEIPINEVVLDKVNTTIEKGTTAELTATVNPTETTDNDKTIKWKSSDESVVTVSQEKTNSGEVVVVTATDKGGTATITATAWNGTKASCKITVPIHLEGIVLPAETSLLRGKTTVLDVTYNPENTTDEKSVTWTSDNDAVATVDAVTGKITAVKEGTANITAAAVNTNLTATTKVTVQENRLTPELGNGIAFSEMDEILKGQSRDMNGALNLKNLIDENQITDDIHIEWSVADGTVAAIDQNGMLIGLKEGETSIAAIVTATDASGNVSGTYTVITDIKVKEISLDSIAFNKIITEMTVGQVDVLGIIYNPANTTDVRDVVWTSSDASVLSVEGGKLTALKEGVAEITAKVGEKTVSCKITVKANSTGTGGADNGSAGSQNGSNKGVSTGDVSNIGLYISLLIMSMIVLVITWRKRIVK